MAGPATPIDGEPWTSDEVDEATQQIIDHNAELAQRVGNRTLTQLEDDLSGAFATGALVDAVTARGPLLAFDRFGGSGALAGAPAEAGGTWENVSGQTTWGPIKTGVGSLRRSVSADAVAVLDLGKSDVVLGALCFWHPTANGTGGLVVRSGAGLGADHLIIYTTPSGDVGLSKRQGGTTTALVTASPPSPRLQSVYRLEAVVVGPYIRAWSDSGAQLTYELAGDDAISFGPQTRHGVICRGNDSVRVSRFVAWGVPT